MTVSGGTIGAYVWDYAGKMDLARFFWDAAIEINPDAAAMDEAASGFRYDRPGGACRSFRDPLWTKRESELTAVDILTPSSTDFEDYWRPFLGGRGPAPAYAMALDEGISSASARADTITNLAAGGWLDPGLPPRAWAVRRRPRSW